MQGSVLVSQILFLGIEGGSQGCIGDMGCSLLNADLPGQLASLSQGSPYTGSCIVADQHTFPGQPGILSCHLCLKLFHCCSWSGLQYSLLGLHSWSCPAFMGVRILLFFF